MAGAVVGMFIIFAYPTPSKKEKRLSDGAKSEVAFCELCASLARFVLVVPITFDFHALLLSKQCLIAVVFREVN